MPSEGGDPTARSTTIMGTGGRRILIVDDNMELGKMVECFLKDHGFEITVASNGKMAIEKVSSEFPELVLLDLNLPDISGGQVLKRIKEINQDIAIIIITAYGGEQVAIDLMKAGAMDFLSKPFEFGVLLKAIQSVLSMRDAQIQERWSRYSSLERFFPFLAHEVRNPLHAIGGALAIIRGRSDLRDPVLTQSIKIIEEEVQHLNQFVQECLEFVRPPVQTRFIAVEINQVLSVVINIVSHMFEELSKKIGISFDLDSRLPMIHGNYDEIKQTFLNIVKNSFEAMGEGGELIIKTSFKSLPSPGWVEIVFTDNGPGIKKGNIEKLFSPFFTTKSHGTGLGLAVCQRIINERHHGEIHIKSKEGQGTTVILKLPVSQATDIVTEE